MTALTAAALIAVFSQTTTDSAELSRAQIALESYLSRIKTLHITYTEKSSPPNSNDAQSWSQELLYAFPSLRMTTIDKMLTKSDDKEQLVERKTTTSIHQGRMVTVNHSANVYEVNGSADPLHYPWLPLEPLGLRAISTLNTPISEFLKYPEITSFEGEEMIDGNQVITLSIGPHIPAQIRPHYWSDKAVLRLSLSPNHNYLPVRSELIHSIETAPRERFQMSLGDFRSVSDLSRGSPIIFPHRLEVVFSNGAAHLYNIEVARINPRVSPSDFVLQPPKGSVIAKDGTLTMSGGAHERDRKLKQSAEEAKQLLSSIDPPRFTPRRWSAWIVSIVVASMIAVLVAVFLNRRART